MENKFYSKSEAIMIEAAKNLEKLNLALQMDLMLLEMEEKVGLMDGIPLEDWKL